MEDEKKKKKNKKKRNKQDKQTTLSAEKTAAREQDHCIQDAAVSEPDAKSDQIDEARGVTSNVILDEDVRQLEAEKHSWLQREKQLEEGIKHAVMDKTSWSLKEATLEEKIEHLQNDKDSFIQKEANMEEKVKQLQRKKGLWIQMEENLVEQIKQLRTELESLILKERSTQETIARLTAINVGLQIQVKELNESKNDVVQENQQLVENISLLKSRIQHLERECPSSDSSGVVKKESSEDENPSILIESASALVEKLVIENAELVEKVNELYIELERRRGPSTDSSFVKFNPIMINGGTHTNRLQDSLLENSGKNESVPTMQTLHEITREPNVPITLEPGTLHEITREPNMPFTLEPGTLHEITREPNMPFTLEPGTLQEITRVLDVPFTAEAGALPTMQTLHEITRELDVPFTLEPGTLHEITRVPDVPFTAAEAGAQLEELSLESHQSGGIGEIVSVPLQEDEIQEIEEVNLHITEIKDPSAVPFSDAPLIGAPFRLISFVAKYVSGADLVENGSHT
ncbi:WEB family protein At4g27595, chloroplastic-like [Aristolochia californica]|uniref:WEB family protein At4g27595, chloroplastic-like n=1 Tax=Aristolochia californica TaxID=171875 RepID=UPI0035DEE858